MDRYFRRLKMNLDRAVQAARYQWMAGLNGNAKVIAICPNCSQKLRIPLRRNKLIVTCTLCRHEFPYQYYALGISSSSHRPLLAGLAGGLLGFVLVELILAVLMAAGENTMLETTLVFGIFGASLGAAIGAAEGFFNKNRPRMLFGLQVVGALGLISGLITGLLAELVVPGMLSFTPITQAFPWGLLVLSRIAASALFGLLIGGAMGLKENTRGDLKYGLLGGAIGGALGGFLFGPFSPLLDVGDGALGRLLAFLLLGISIAVAVGRLRELGLSRDGREMFIPLSSRLPANPRIRAQAGRRTY